MELRERDLAGISAFESASALLLRVRAEDPNAGLWEAGDIYWWWAAGEGDQSRITIWADPTGRDVAYLVLVGAISGMGAAGRVEADFGWLPSADAAVRLDVLPRIVARLASFPAAPDAPVAAFADERDVEVCRLLEEAGFRHEPAEDIVQMLRPKSPLPPDVPLPPGFVFDDERSRPPGAAHHLVRRNGDRVAERLRDGTLYRPDLDLCIRADGGEVAAYCLCWLDGQNRVGLFEPVRTEDAFQRRGLGTALMREGIRRLVAGGAVAIKVSRAAESEAAARLYRGVGFEDAFRKRQYLRTA